MMTNDSKDQGLEAFEAWITDADIGDLAFGRDGECYVDWDTQVAWRGWKARDAACSSAVAVGEPLATSAEPVAWVYCDTLHSEHCHLSDRDAIEDGWLPLVYASHAGFARADIKELAIKCGFEYWRASDAHGVAGTIKQAEDMLASLLGVEVEIGGGEAEVASLASRSAATVSDEASVALTDERIIDIWCNTPTTRFGSEVEDQEIIDFARVLLDASQAATTAGTQDQQADLAFSVYSGLNALRWLLNITTEFDRKDVRTRQAARLLDEYMDSFGKSNRDRLEDMWKTLYDKLPDDGRISEYLRAHDAARRAASSATPLTSDSEAIELLRKFMEFRDSDYVPNVLFDRASKVIDRAQSTNGEADGN